MSPSAPCSQIQRSACSAPQLWPTIPRQSSISSDRPATSTEPEKKEWDTVVDRAIAHLRSTQAKDGSWSAKGSPGVTGIVLTGVLKTGRVQKNDPMVKKALEYIESLINTEKGHIAGKDPNVKLQNYVT